MEILLVTVLILAAVGGVAYFGLRNPVQPPEIYIAPLPESSIAQASQMIAAPPEAPALLEAPQPPTPSVDDDALLDDLVVRGSYPSSEDDLFWERFYLKRLNALRPIEKAFYTKLAGTSYKNEDGSSRLAAIRKCEEGTPLEIIAQPDNEFDPNAIAVFDDGKQLGFLQARLAGEMTQDFKRYGARYYPIFCRPTRRETTNRVAGGLVFMIRFYPKIAEPETTVETPGEGHESIPRQVFA